MCNCIKVNYTPIGQEPISIEVNSNGVINSKNYYEFIYDNQTLTITWGGSFWIMGVYLGAELWMLSQDVECPIGAWDNNDDTTYFSAFSIEECMPRRTVSYSNVSVGWNSFWSYQPDWMTEMNSTFYSFKNGELWKHNVNTIRNNFYGEQYLSSIRTIFNADPLTVKVFNTLSLNSTHPWDSSVYTNISAGNIASTYFAEKEGQWFAYIRRFDDTIDVKALSTQGIGSADSVDSTTPSAVVLDFLFNVDSSISIGDKIYKNSGGDLVLIGIIVGLSINSITIDTSIGNIPTTSDFLICVKNSQAESFGTRGYYMNVYLYNDSTEQVKLFSIGTSVFKSFL
jgi:hypothetical protein